MKDVYVQDCYAGADPEYRMPVRIITENAWHSLFARNMFIQSHDRRSSPSIGRSSRSSTCRSFHAIPELDGTNSETFILLNFAEQLVLIGGTSYAGEIKKSIFSVMNYLLPLKDVLPMHCSANIGQDGDSALFFGLSAAPARPRSPPTPRAQLIGDDEHGWSDNGVFNFEGGCYAKVIRLSPEAEPEIYSDHPALRHGAGERRHRRHDPPKLDLDDASLTENTRGAYPITAHRQRHAGRPGRPSHEHRVPDRRTPSACCRRSRG